MNTESNNGMTLETIERQVAYVQEQERKGNGLGIVFADAFLRGMRDIGYKSPAWALAEMIDNSFQASARTISIRFGFRAQNQTQTKPDFMAIIDDGNGMIPQMISYAVRWGGTDRENDRRGFGRYGYGLPSAAVSIAKRYTAYSKTDGGNWNCVTVDLDQLADAAHDLKKTEELLAPKAATIPPWVLSAEDKINLVRANSGTLIVLEDLDGLRNKPGWIKTDSLQTKLLQNFGVIYRHWVPQRRLFVQGTEVVAVDPLFLMEHARFYDETPIKAIPVETRTIEVETDRGVIGKITIRAALLPPNFQHTDSTHYSEKAPLNKRFPTMKEWHGLLICREKRHIDTVMPKWTTFQNRDRNIKIEVDFEPELDEYFGITTTKQQIVIDDEMWDRLRQSGRNCGGLYDLIEDMRRHREEIRRQLEAQSENISAQEQSRPSVLVIEATEKFKEIAPPPPTEEQSAEASRNLEHEASKISIASRRPKQEILLELEEQAKKRRWEIEFAATPEGPFYRPKRFGEQKRVTINTEHPFYTKMYNVASSEVKAAIEVLLFVLAERELESTGDAETFYKAERQRWSQRLRIALDLLMPDEPMADKANAVAEQLHISLSAEQSS